VGGLHEVVRHSLPPLAEGADLLPAGGLGAGNMTAAPGASDSYNAAEQMTQSTVNGTTSTPAPASRSSPPRGTTSSCGAGPTSTAKP